MEKQMQMYKNTGKVTTLFKGTFREEGATSAQKDCINIKCHPFCRNPASSNLNSRNHTNHAIINGIFRGCAPESGYEDIKIDKEKLLSYEKEFGKLPETWKRNLKNANAENCDGKCRPTCGDPHPTQCGGPKCSPGNSCTHCDHGTHYP